MDSAALCEQGDVLQPHRPDRLSDRPAGPGYVCFTKPRQEQYSAGKLQEQGCKVCLIRLERWAQQTGQWGKQQTVMFSRHAFVRSGRGSHALGLIASTRRGVTSFVKFGSVPAMLADHCPLALRC